MNEIVLENDYGLFILSYKLIDLNDLIKHQRIFLYFNLLKNICD